MIYHPRENKVTKIIKIFAFWSSILAMIWLFIMMFYDDVKIPQRQAVLKIDLKNKVNICSPEKDDLFKEKFFNF